VLAAHAYWHEKASFPIPMVMLMQCFASWLVMVLLTAAGAHSSVSDCGVPAEGSALLQTQQPIRKVDALIGHPAADLQAPAAQLQASSPPLVDHYAALALLHGAPVAQAQVQAASVQATSAMPSHGAALVGHQSPDLLAARLQTRGALPAATEASVSHAAFHVSQSPSEIGSQPRDSVMPSALSASVNHTAPQLPGYTSLKLTGESKDNFVGRQESEFTQIASATQATVNAEAQVDGIHSKKIKTFLGSFAVVDLLCMAFAAIVMFLFLVLADIL